VPDETAEFRVSRRSGAVSASRSRSGHAGSVSSDAARLSPPPKGRVPKPRVAVSKGRLACGARQSAAQARDSLTALIQGTARDLDFAQGEGAAASDAGVPPLRVGDASVQIGQAQLDSGEPRVTVCEFPLETAASARSSLRPCEGGEQGPGSALDLEVEAEVEVQPGPVAMAALTAFPSGKDLVFAREHFFSFTEQGLAFGLEGSESIGQCGAASDPVRVASLLNPKGGDQALFLPELGAQATRQAIALCAQATQFFVIAGESCRAMMGVRGSIGQRELTCSRSTPVGGSPALGPHLDERGERQEDDQDASQVSHDALLV
jgi:hypothetical protein